MGFRKCRTAIESAFRISINIQKVKKEWSYLKLINIPNADINGIIYNVVFNILICFCGNNFLLNPFIMVEVWAMNPTPNSMYMAHQYRLLDCKRGFSANKSRKMVMKMFTISVVFFIFCCKFYTFFYVCMLGHCCAECRMMQRVLQRFGRPSAMFGNSFAAHPQSVSSRRGPIYRARIYVFATHSQSVQNTFTERSQRVRFLYVTYSHYKSMVFDVQKYGF